MAYTTVNTSATSAEKKEKAPNYTPEQTAKILADYATSPTEETVQALAVELGKTVRSIIAKLSREKVYVKKAYVTKAGTPPQKKDTTADAIAKVLKLSDGEADSLTKANKTALVKIFSALANSTPMDEKDSPEEQATKQQSAQIIARGAELSPEEAGSLLRLNSATLLKLRACFVDFHAEQAEAEEGAVIVE